MTIFYCGSEPSSVRGTFTVDTSGTYNASCVRCALGVNLDQSVLFDLPEEISPDSEAGYWIHFRVKTPATQSAPGGSGHTLWRGRAANSDLCFEMHNRYVDSYSCFWTLDVYGSDASSARWSNPTERVDLMVAGTMYTVDIHVYRSATDTKCDIYKNGALGWSVTLAGKAGVGLKTIELSNSMTNGTNDAAHRCYYSEWIVADVDTRMFRVASAYVSGEGTHTDGTGAYTDVDEIETDGAAITLSGGQKRTFTLTKVGTWPMGGVQAFAVNGLVASDGAGGDLKAMIRVGSTDYESAAMGLSGTPAPTSQPWNTNPATGAGWGSLDPETLEIGYDAIAAA